MPWNIIPQIFYDLIARVVPGSVVLIVGYLTFLGPMAAISSIITASPTKNVGNVLNFGMFVLGFILSYILGFILNELWQIIFEHAHKKWSLRKRTVFKLTERSLEKLEDWKDKKKRIPDESLERLTALKDQRFTTVDSFIEAVENQIGVEQFTEYKKLILKYTLEKQPIVSVLWSSKKRTAFGLTERSLNKLQKKWFPDEILKKLAELKDREFPTEDSFIEAVEKQIGVEQFANYKERILEHTRKKRLIVSVLWSSKKRTVFKLTDRSLEKLKKKPRIPDESLKKLTELKDERFTTEDSFIEAVEKQIGVKQVVEYRNLILKYARKKLPIESALRYYNEIREVLGLKPLKLRQKLLVCEDLPPVHTMYDHLRLRPETESQAYRLLKLRAEHRLSQSLFIGFLLLAFLNIGAWIYGFKFVAIDRALLEIFLLLALYPFWRKSERHERFYIHGTCTQWLLSSFLLEPQKAEFQEEEKLR